MRGKRGWRWWVMRLELAAGVAAVAVGLLLAPSTLPGFVRAPFNGEPIVPPPWGWLIPLGAMAGMGVGLGRMLRIFEGPRDEPLPWRYRRREPGANRYRADARSRSRRPAPGLDRAPGWWPTRILLAVGVASVVVIVLGGLAQGALPHGLSEPSVSLGPLLVPSSGAVSIAAFAVALFGLIWMIRIFRGSQAEPPAWLYRAR